MLEINTIEQFLALPANVRDEIQKAILTKNRLEDFLRSQNKRVGKDVPKMEPHWEQCKRCKQWGQPGWVWKEEYVRDDSDIHPSQINKCVKFLMYSCIGCAGEL